MKEGFITRFCLVFMNLFIAEGKESYNQMNGSLV